jgi:1-phosphatidylinositol-4-phosphate 5-kinase
MMTRYHGLYKLVHNPDQKIFFIVMNNLFPDSENIQERYDLKGSTSNRSVDSTSDPRLSYKDLDFVKRVGKIKLGTDRSREFMAQLRRDCEFLCKHDILDYSLLLGISTSSFGSYSKHKLSASDGVTTYFTGIIDMLTQFNSKKKVEYFFKFFVYKDEMSCVPPNLYAERFLNFIESVLE